jgi:hypothetical protein
MRGPTPRAGRGGGMEALETRAWARRPRLSERERAKAPRPSCRRGDPWGHRREPTGSGRGAGGHSEARDPGAASKSVSTGTGAGPAPHTGWRGAGAVADSSETGRAELDGEVEAVWPQPSRPAGAEGSPEIVSTVTELDRRTTQGCGGQRPSPGSDWLAKPTMRPVRRSGRGLGPAGAENASEIVLTGTGAEPAHHSGLRGAEAVAGL